MYKIPDNIKQFYLDEPEKLNQRILLSMQLLEDYLKEHDLMAIASPVFKEWEHLWKIAKTFWQFPDEEDMKKLVDKHYANL